MLPLLAPGIVVAVVVAVLVSRPLARWFGAPPLMAAVIVLNVGVLLAATLTPLLPCDCAPAFAPTGSCDLSRIGLASAADLLGPSDILANVVVLAPLGFAIALVPGSRRKTALLVTAIALPFVIEAIQLVATPLHRACQSADVVDNLTGLVIGLAAGFVLLRFMPADRRPGEPEG